MLTQAHSQKAFVIWFTGLPGSGKTTLALEVHRKLVSAGHVTEHLDGDVIRTILTKPGFSRNERNAHIESIGFLASRLEAHGVSVVASLISPYAESREKVKSLCQNFLEVYVDTPLDICKARDPKGLYAKADRGEVKALTGVSDPYEVPAAPDLVIKTASQSVDNCVNQIFIALEERHFL